MGADERLLRREEGNSSWLPSLSSTLSLLSGGNASAKVARRPCLDWPRDTGDEREERREEAAGLEHCELRGREREDVDEDADEVGRLDEPTAGDCSVVLSSSSRGGRNGWLCCSFSIGGAYVESEARLPCGPLGDTSDGSGTYELLRNDLCDIANGGRDEVFPQPRANWTGCRMSPPHYHPIKQWKAH